MHIAIFASGSGSNAENIIRYFRSQFTDGASFTIYCNKPGAGVLSRAADLGVETLVFNRQDFYQSEQVLFHMQARNTEWVVLAGFLWLVPGYLIRAYRQRIVNIHPALLPNFGGKGMYGMHVHQAVVEQQARQTGITIHYANEYYDEGDIIFQAACEVSAADTPEMVAQKVHALEYAHFPRVIAQLAGLIPATE